MYKIGYFVVANNACEDKGQIFNYIKNFETVSFEDQLIFTSIGATPTEEEAYDFEYERKVAAKIIENQPNLDWKLFDVKVEEVEEKEVTEAKTKKLSNR